MARTVTVSLLTMSYSSQSFLHSYCQNSESLHEATHSTYSSIHTLSQYICNMLSTSARHIGHFIRRTCMLVANAALHKAQETRCPHGLQAILAAAVIQIIHVGSCRTSGDEWGTGERERLRRRGRQRHAGPRGKLQLAVQRRTPRRSLPM